MSIKIFGELEEKIKKMVSEGYIMGYISKETGINAQTIGNWASRNNFVFGNYRNPELKAMEIAFVELLKNGYILKHACEKINLYHSTGVLWAKRNGYSSVLRSRAEAAKDRVLSLEEVNKRLPKGHGVVVSGDSGIYVIQRTDGTTYSRITSQIFRGDPNLSEKRRSTEEEIATKL